MDRCHVREHGSVLAAGEKRLLIAIAARLPSWINSDQLTLLAFAAMLAAGASFAALQSWTWSAPAFVAALAVNWFGDSLDGTLARVRDRQRPRYGYYVDHVLDLAGTSALVAGMAASGSMTPSVAFVALAAYFAVAAESYLAAHTVGVFRIAFGGVGPTELRILLAIGAVAIAGNPWCDIAGRRLLILDVGGAIAAAGMAGAFVVSAARNGRALYRAEPLAAER